MRKSDGKLCFSEDERVWKDYMERIMNEENDWHHNVEGDAVDGPVVCLSRGEVVQTSNEMKTGNTPGPSDVSLELIAAQNIVVPLLKRGKMMSRTAIAIVAKRLEFEMKVVERVLEKRLHRMLTVNVMQNGFIGEKGTIDAVVLMTRL